jgi:hypothetical protein
MEFTIELRYQGGSSTVLSVEADSADQALEDVRDQRRLLVGIHITGPGQDGQDATAESGRRTTFTQRRVPVRHRPSRRRL